jgi:TonB family protein
MKTCLARRRGPGARWLPLLLFGALAARPAAAQYYGQYPADTSRIFSYVEQMPALPGGGGNLALVKTIQRQLQLPAEVCEGRVEGRVFVRMVIGVSGVARQASVVQSLSPSCDAAALAAVQHLPRLVPGRYNGMPVAVLLTVPVVFFSPRHVFSSSEVAGAPQFPGGSDALDAYLKKSLVLPNEVKLRDLRGRVTVRFVLRADGRVGATEVVSSLCPSCDDEALRLVRAMPRWQPALGYDDQPVAVYQALNIWFQPPPPPAGIAAPVPETQIYAQVEKMPQLAGGGGPGAIKAALQELIEYPERALAGQGQVSFVVEPDGRVTRPTMVKSIGNELDDAIMAAALRLPRFEPGRQNGRPVAVRLVVPVEVEIH